MNTKLSHSKQQKCGKAGHATRYICIGEDRHASVDRHVDVGEDGHASVDTSEDRHVDVGEDGHAPKHVGEDSDDSDDCDGNDEHEGCDGEIYINISSDELFANVVGITKKLIKEEQAKKGKCKDDKTLEDFSTRLAIRMRSDHNSDFNKCYENPFQIRALLEKLVISYTDNSINDLSNKLSNLYNKGK
jgi:hypothetical protein